jgi:NADPH:quinone reductase-like Zn-dependent oxidoreductase
LSAKPLQQFYQEKQSLDVASSPDYVAWITGEETSSDSAATVPLVALTVMQALEKVDMDPDRWSEQAFDPCFPGGVGTFAMQYVKHVLGMYVAFMALAAKDDHLKELGADLVLDYRDETNPFKDIIQDYDVVLDPMSWAYESRTLGKGKKVLKTHGTLLEPAKLRLGMGRLWKKQWNAYPLQL